MHGERWTSKLGNFRCAACLVPGWALPSAPELVPLLVVAMAPAPVPDPVPPSVVASAVWICFCARGVT